jgi:hypothetical protein
VGSPDPSCSPPRRQELARPSGLLLQSKALAGRKLADADGSRQIEAAHLE